MGAEGGKTKGEAGRGAISRARFPGEAWAAEDARERQEAAKPPASQDVKALKTQKGVRDSPAEPQRRAPQQKLKSGPPASFR